MDTPHSDNKLPDQEISEQSLLFLLAVSFVVGITGLYFALDPTATGFAVFNATNTNRTAQANITIVSNVAIQIDNGWDFGVGFVNDSTGKAVIQSGGSGGDPYNYTNWTATTNGSDQVTLRNVGNINVTVRANANQSSDRWFCSDAFFGRNNQSLNTTGGSTSGSSNCVTSFTFLTNVTQVNTTTGTLLCASGSLGISETTVVDMEIQIDERCPATITDVFETVTFFAYS